MRDKAKYFTSYEDLKRKLKEMWDNRQFGGPDEKKWVKDNYSKGVMERNINERLCQLKSTLQHQGK